MRLLWGFLNSAFGIWLLSTSVVGFGAAIITDQQSCRAQAIQLSERYFRISGEVEQREAKLFRAVLAANSAGQVASALASLAGPQAPYRYLEFKDRTLADLVEEYHELSGKLQFATFGGAQRFVENLKLMTSSRLESARQTFDRALDGNPFDTAELKKAAQDLTELQPAIRQLDLFLGSGRQCTFWRAFTDRVGLI